MSQPNQEDVYGLTYAVDYGTPSGDQTALSIRKNNIVYTFVGKEAEVINELIESERVKARFIELDLYEQFLNSVDNKRITRKDLYDYKMRRLADLEKSYPIKAQQEKE